MARNPNPSSSSSKTFKLISLFTGAGGLDLGFEAAGFHTSVAVEMDSNCCETIRANRDWGLIERNVHDVPSDELLEVAGLRPGEPDLLIGGPPCQPFSKSSYWVHGDSRRLDDPRANTLSAYLRILRDTKPRAFLLENVFGLAYKGKDEGLQFLLDATDEINRACGTNYQISWKVLQAADYGVPQLRQRVFLVGHREGRAFYFPSPRFAEIDANGDQLPLLSLEPYRTAWDALGDLPEPAEKLAMGGKWADLLPTIPEGQNYLWHTDRMDGLNLFGWRTRYWSFLLKLAKEKPSWTIQAQPGSAIGPFHWTSRKLSSRELCRLQTFPDDYEIQGGRSSVQRQLGNAVPSLLAEVLAREIRTQLLDSPPSSDQLRLLPPRRTPVPPPEALVPVPQKYLHLVGKHAAHPGTGKGRKASRREAAQP